MKFYICFILLMLLSCQKEQLPKNKTFSLSGLFVFRKVKVSIVDNSTYSGNTIFENGQTFINENEASGFDSITTDFSLIMIKKNKIFLNPEIKNLDTLWKINYDCFYTEIYSNIGGKLVFYPNGSKRDFTIESLNGKDFIINPPMIWPYSNNGPAFNLIYVLQKIY